MVYEFVKAECEKNSSNYQGTSERHTNIIEIDQRHSPIFVCSGVLRRNKYVRFSVCIFVLPSQ
jgi:hypothetical protein